MIFQGPCFDQFKINDVNVMEEDDHLSSSSSSSSSIGDDSSTSSSFDTTDDASSDSSPPHDSSNSSYYDLSDLMAQLPIKRGLSKFYQGKSQSYISDLSRLTSIEDLAKKESPYRRKMKACKSYGGGLDTYKSHTLPKPIISKKSSSRGSFLMSRKPTFRSVCRPPLVPVQHNL